MKKKLFKLTAHILFISSIYQLIFPVCAHALTTGPSQPEVQSFEPVGTTEMVDMFSGSFVYNVPLLDVEGYPVNIAYHSGINMEQEASWVGLGWNINPGEINRTVRGIPDDFDGDLIEKELNIAPETNWRLGAGGSANLEIVGYDPSKNSNIGIGVNAGVYVNGNNYKGLSVGANGGVTFSFPCVSVGVNMGIGSQTGADMDLNASVGYSTTREISDNDGSASASIGVSGSTGFNTRTGLKDISFGVVASLKKDDEQEDKKGKIRSTQDGISESVYGSRIPIGLQNYVPIVTNKSYQEAYQFQLKFGAEAQYFFPNLYASFSKSVLTYDGDGSRHSYGYLYSENAPDDGLMDFSRDKDGIYNKTLPNLPSSSMTYDIYSISGQGTGGMFRPFRNDIGTVFDAKTESKTESQSYSLEGGIGNLWEAGADMDFVDNENTSGPWQRLHFAGTDPGTLYQKAFFKQAGELTYNQQQSAPQLFNTDLQYVAGDQSTLIGMGYRSVGSLPAKFNNANIYWDGSTIDRSSRANLLTYFTAAQASVPDVAQSQTINDFADTGRPYDPVMNQRPRYVTSSAFAAKPNHISEFTQTLPDGRRYIYGIPAMNNVTREVTFAVDDSKANFNTGMVGFTRGTDDSKNNRQGTDNFYSSTNTPAYAHSYLLTSVLSDDYVDILGDGPTDDDLGTFVKFNYSLCDSDYRWRSPYPLPLDSANDQAQFNPGFYCDKYDDRGNYIIGSRQQWHIKSIESKNFIAEFYISQRNDGVGVTNPVLPPTSVLYASNTSLNYMANYKTSPSLSYKLDSIKLYNKHDRYIHEDQAIPIKTVIFNYDYSLCPGIPNVQSTTNSLGTGKLTLKNIYIKYGNSNKSLLSPYTFSYNNPNPSYNFGAKDRWGNYQVNAAPRTNYEFPYTNQSASSGLDDSASCWNLTNIKLPSGGMVNVAYERNDYSFVQNKRTMQMFDVAGFGSSPSLQKQSILYHDYYNINQYVYFQRDTAAEDPDLSIRDNYLENTPLLYYSFDMDITGTGRFEHIKAYATIQDFGICPNNSNYCFIKIQNENAGNMQLHPATIYGLNIARYYLPHILYPGFKNGDGDKKVLEGLLEALREAGTMPANPFSRFIQQNMGKNVYLPFSTIRLQRPGLTKKGGGSRVKQLTLTDNWATLSSNPNAANAVYGKRYDYTIEDDRYGEISSGVASYEPMVGGDENPFHLPVPYSVDAGKLLPAIDFYQEQPFGESFFPAAVVGYSSVKVTSINSSVGRSSQYMDENLFYTAKDFPVAVNFTEKNDPGANSSRTFDRMYTEEQALQGYTLKFNDMHGKPKAVNNYVVHIASQGAPQSNELITGITYNYQTNTDGSLNNTVKSFMRVRGYPNKYDVQNITLGQEMDFTVDSREKYNRNYDRTVALNLNVVYFGIVLVPIPTAFAPDKEDVNVFKTQVSTKIVQQYGILKSVETFDHGAKTLVENEIYDSETGKVLLSRTNNEYNDHTYNLKYPAYLAYTTMGPSYYNDGFDVYLDSLQIIDQQALLPLSLYQKITAGDEVLLQSKGSSDTITHTIKLWAMTPLVDQLDLDDGHPPTATASYSLLVPRCRDVVDASGNITPYWNWVDSADMLRHVYLRVLRSGNRNRLDRNVQEATLTANPYNNNVSDLMSGPYTSATSGIYNFLNIKVNEFDNSSALFAPPYIGFDTVGRTVGIYDYTAQAYTYLKNFNDYVLGRAGLNRPVVSYDNLANRDYSKGHARYDGGFNCLSFWTFANNSTGNGYENINKVLTPPSSTVNWRPSNFVTNYDVFGNVIEEVDPVGNYSSAQYGYNKHLPVLVASNATESSCMFDGFEDYCMLVPERARTLFATTAYAYSPFSAMFTTPVDVSSKNYQALPAGQVNNPMSFIRYGQIYNLYDSNAYGTTSIIQLTTEASHTGNYSLKNTGTNSITINTKSPGIPVPFYSRSSTFTFDKFQLLNGKKYLVDFWVKPIGSLPSFTYYTSGSTSPQTMLQKTRSIDGWYLMEGTIDLTSGSSTSVTINLPPNIYLDDIRFLPTDANVKSFVYDPFTFRQIAQLDENHFATFYEYDQEGLLVRVKKETSQGILTVSESRRSNAKK